MLAASDVVLTASGTATVQTALHERPMVIVYRLSKLTYAMGRPFVKIDTFGMVNLVAERKIAPELIQDDFTPESAAREIVTLLTDDERACAHDRGDPRRQTQARRPRRQPPRRRCHPARGPREAPASTPQPQTAAPNAAGLISASALTAASG